LQVRNQVDTEVFEPVAVHETPWRTGSRPMLWKASGSATTHG
jgi:hypothetical protein